MAFVVFMRGVNVGGHKTFKPAALARELVELDVVNVGAAGTFVVRKPVSQAALRDALRKRLPFEAELMLCKASDVLELTSFESLMSGTGSERETRGFVSIMATRPRGSYRLPISHPAGDDWHVKILEIQNRFALSLWRPLGSRMLYPNEVVEKRFGVAATTRSWNTIRTICEVLRRA